MSERKSYLQMLNEGLRMMKQAKQAEQTLTLRQWTLSVRRDSEWHMILRTDRLKWIGPPSVTLVIEPLFVQCGTLHLTRHLESNEIRLKIEEEWGIESKVVCDDLEWERFIEALKRMKGE